MAITSTTNKVIYTGSGTAGPFDFDFKIFESSDLKIEKFTIATETSVTLTETTDYTVAIDGDGTGAVTLVAVLSSSYKLIITRELPLTQEVSYVEGDKFPAITHEEALDRAAMRDQQLKEELDRCVKVVAGATTSPDELVDSLVTASAEAVQAAADAEAAKVIAEAAAGSMTLASQAEAEAGTENTKYLSSLRTSQAITALQRGIASKAEAEAGSINTKDMTPLRVAEAIAVLAPVEAAWSDYSTTSTIVGWISFTEKSIKLKKIGKIVFISFFIRGTSNNTATSFTIPYTVPSTPYSVDTFIRAQDNTGSPSVGFANLGASSNVIAFYKDAAASAWTASGTKFITGQLFFEVP